MELNPRRIVGGLNPLRVGVALMLVGGSTLGLGLVQTTTASMQPSCPGGTQLIAKFEWSGRHYDFDGPSGNGSVAWVTSSAASSVIDEVFGVGLIGIMMWDPGVPGSIIHGRPLPSSAASR